MKLFFTTVVVACAIAGTSLAVEIGSTTQPIYDGPDVVVLQELVNLYQPVPFNHRSHAQMSEMWDGCTTCHHRQPIIQPVDAESVDHHDQNDADKIPACKSCHEIAPDRADIEMPTLKAAYHRQCLNCHRDWAEENSCTVCHETKNGPNIAPPASADDIVGRMCPPVPQPTIKTYIARFTPAVGGNVIFRHQEHTTKYGLRCVNCHRNDTCTSCHSPDAESVNRLKPGQTWAQTHAMCIGCHQNDRCRTCHYDDKQSPPAPFDHAVVVGQLFDKDHSDLKCGQCHPVLKARKVVTCGDASCHKSELAIAFPEKRPGPVAMKTPTTAPSTRPVVEIRDEPSGTIVKRVRRPTTSQ